MPIEAKDVLEFLGIDPATDSLDKVKESFDQTFIKKDPFVIKGDNELHGKIIGQYNGSVSALIRRQAKEAGIELSDDELKGKNPLEMVDFVLPKITTTLGGKIKTLEEETKKGVDKKLTELQTAFDTYKAEVEPKINSYTGLEKEYNDFKVAVETEKKTTKVNQYNDEAWKGFKWANGKSDLEKEGFQSRFNKKYRVELFDDGNPWPVNDKGERIPNPKQAGSFKSLPDLLMEEGMAEKVWAVAGGTQPLQRQTFTVKEETTVQAGLQPNPGARKRIVNTSTRQTV